MIILIIIILIALGIFAVSTYNSLQSLNVNIDEAKSQINVQLQRRADLIPNLVAIVKGYAKHESGTLTEITKLRSGLTHGSLSEKMDANNELTKQVNNIFAVAENYPDLKANTEFSKLQEELVNTENKVGYARQLYNSCVGTYNRAIVKFPGSIIANFANLQKHEYLEDNRKDIQDAPKISF